MKISVIIPTYNSERTLEECLSSLRNQPYKNIEIVVIDQSSSDKTKEIANKYKVKFVTLPKPKFYSPPSQSRNIGAKEAIGDVLYHLDSDMYVSKSLIGEIADRFNINEDVGALIVHEKDLPVGFWSKAKALERKCYWRNDNIESARVVRKDLFDSIGGYDESINSGEDFDIHRRYKERAKVEFCDNVVYHDLNRISYFYTIKKKYNYGKTAHKYFEKHRNDKSTTVGGFSLLKGQFSCFMKNYRLFIKNPLVGLGTVSLKISEFTAGILGYVVGRSRNEEYHT